MGTVNELKPLTCGQYTDFLCILNRNKGTNLFLKGLHEYIALFHRKDDLKVLNEGYEPLTLNRITLLGHRFKTQVISDPRAKEVEQQLLFMANHKIANENQRYFFARLIRKLLDCAQNFFQGNGFRTTTALTLELSLWLKTNIKPIATQENRLCDSPPPIGTEEEKIAPTSDVKKNSQPKKKRKKNRASNSPTTPVSPQTETNPWKT